jgi:hypothetical protein
MWIFVLFGLLGGLTVLAWLFARHFWKQAQKGLR